MNTKFLTKPIGILFTLPNPHARVGNGIGKLQQPRGRRVDLSKRVHSLEATVTLSRLSDDPLAFGVAVVVVAVQNELDIAYPPIPELVKSTELPNGNLHCLNHISSIDRRPTALCDRS